MPGAQLAAQFAAIKYNLDLDPDLRDKMAKEFADDNGVALSGEVSAAKRESCGPDVRAAAQALGEIYAGRAGHTSRPSLLHGDFYPGSWIQRSSSTSPVSRAWKHRGIHQVEATRKMTVAVENSGVTDLPSRVRRSAGVASTRAKVSR